MNGNQRHMRYRRQVYRRRRIRLILILSAVLLVLLAIGFLIVGNLLKAKEEPSADTEETESEEGTETSAVSLPSTLKARSTQLETTDSSTLSARLRALRQAGASGASVALNRPDGVLLYQSASAVSLGLGNEAYSVTVTQAVKQANDNNLRLSGVWYLTALSEKDELLRSVRLAESAAILAEALREGMDDILLIATDADKDLISELALFAAEVRRLSPEGALGLCIPSRILNDEKSAIWVDDLVEAFDFLAIDATAYGEEKPIVYVESVVASRLDYILRYRMRVLLPYLGDTEAEDAVIALTEQYSAKSWQILPFVE